MFGQGQEGTIGRIYLRQPLNLVLGVTVLIGGCVVLGAAIIAWSPPSLTFVVLTAVGAGILGIAALLRPMHMLCVFLFLWGPTLFLMKDVEIGRVAGVDLTLNKLVGLLFLATFSVHFAVRVLRPNILVGLPGPAKRYLLFGILFCASLCWSPDAMRGVFDVMRFSAGTAILITIIIMSRDSIPTLNMIQFSLIGGILIAAVMTVAMPLVGADTRVWNMVGVERVAGTLAGPGGTSALFVNGIAAVLPLFACSKTVRARLLWIAALVLLIVGVVLTVTRSAIIGVPLLVGLWFFLQRKGRRARVALLVVCLVIATYGGFLAFADANTVASRIQDIPFIGNSTLRDDAAGTGRFGLFRVQLEAFENAPLPRKLFGGGVVYSFVVSEASYFGNFTPSWLQAMGPHNCYIYLLSEFGLVGLFAYLAFIGGTISYVYRSLQLVDRESPEGEVAGQRLSSFLAFFITYHLTSEMFGWNIPDFGGRAYFMVFLALGLTVAARVVTNHRGIGVSENRTG